MAKLIDTEAPPGARADSPAAGSQDPAAAAAHQPGAHQNSTFVELERPDVWIRVRKLALRQLDRVVALEPKVLRDESPRPVHDLRVASRRLQALLDFLYAAPRPGEVRKLRRRLRKARQVLGELRNLDVLAGRIERALARKRTAHREAWQTGRDYVLKSRRKTAERAYRKLTRLNLGDLYVRLRQEVAGQPPTADPPPTEPPRVIAFPDDRGAVEPASAASKELAARFAEGLAGLWQDFEARAAESRRERGALHALRISAKRLRYFIEVAAALDVAGSAEALSWLRVLQARLGDWHDYEVLGGTLLEMVARRDFLKEQLPLAIEVEKLVLSLRRAKTRACERFLRGTFKSPEYRRTAEWVAQRTDSRTLTAG
ncbi:MAG TPA: CHAD domain-containing protein [Terriglobia bacterium]|nr:CHAD domain-containing protein [Terriglobia bacterium]